MCVEWLSFTRECNLIGQSRENHWGFWNITSVSVSRLSSQDRASSRDCLSFLTSSNSRLILSSSVFLVWNVTAQEISSINKMTHEKCSANAWKCQRKCPYPLYKGHGRIFQCPQFQIFFKLTVVFIVCLNVVFRRSSFTCTKYLAVELSLLVLTTYIIVVGQIQNGAKSSPGELRQ